MVGSSVSMDRTQVVHPVQLFSDTKMTASNENTNIDFMPRIACVWLIPNTFREISLAVIFCSGMEAARTGKGRIGDETFDPLLWVSVLEFEYVFFPIVHCRYMAGLKLVVSSLKFVYRADGIFRLTGTKKLAAASSESSMSLWL